MTCEIARRQTTYWDLRDDRGITRIHFVGKLEVGFTDPQALSWSIEQDHPVLLDYQFPWDGIYPASPASDVGQVFDDLTHAIEAKLDGWRRAKHYMNPSRARRVLREGCGLLVTGPPLVVEACREVLTSNGIRSSCVPSKDRRWPAQALIVGQNFVVAKSFRVEELG
ncbi:MAG: hypothetical protein K1X53_08835 [Candidatus Sumerlaeaceae bacterium]|nr:hypothetical protein [Candidatus Sumerlaeaceae bacterium]